MSRKKSAVPATPVVPAFDLATAPESKQTIRFDVLDGDTYAPLGFWVEVASRHSPKGRAAQQLAVRMHVDQHGEDAWSKADAATLEADLDVLRAAHSIVAWDLLEHGTPLAVTADNALRLFAKRPDVATQVIHASKRVADFFVGAGTRS